MLLDVARAGGPCIAIRLHPLVQELHTAGVIVDENKIRYEMKQRYGKLFNGTQYFLDPSRVSPVPIRNKHYNNTKHAKCIFIPHCDIEEHIMEKLHLGKLR